MKLTTSLCVVAMSLSIGVDAAKYQVNDAALSKQVDEKHASRGLSRYQNELGPRPFYLLDDMDDGALKSALKRCENRFFNWASRSANAIS